MIQPQRFKCVQIDRLKHPEGGFSLSEVLVAILMTTIFVAVAMQGMVVAMLLKSKAFQMAEATRWVQTDVEGIRSNITLSQVPLGVNRLRCHPLGIDGGFADLIRDHLAGGNVTGVSDYHITPFSVTSKMGKTFQIARTLTIPQTSDNSEGKILGIQYSVSPINGVTLEPAIFQFYTEVMPDAALQCQ